MLKITFSDADIDALQHGRFHHPDPRVQVRMEALYLRSQGVITRDIPRLCGISNASFHRALKASATGGLEQLQHIEPRRPHSALPHHRPTIEAEFRQRPPATVAEAAARMEALPGIARKPTQVRQVLKALGMQPRKVGMRPAKADVDAQEAFKKTSGSRGSRKPRQANAPSCSWMQRILYLHPFGGLSGASNACWSGRQPVGND